MSARSASALACNTNQLTICTRQDAFAEFENRLTAQQCQAYAATDAAPFVGTVFVLVVKIFGPHGIALRRIDEDQIRVHTHGNFAFVREAENNPKPSVNLKTWVGRCIPRGSGIDMNVFLLLWQERRVERAQRYRNPAGKLT